MVFEVYSINTTSLWVLAVEQTLTKESDIYYLDKQNGPLGSKMYSSLDTIELWFLLSVLDLV